MIIIDFARFPLQFIQSICSLVQTRMKKGHPSASWCDALFFKRIKLAAPCRGLTERFNPTATLHKLYDGPWDHRKLVYRVVFKKIHFYLIKNQLNSNSQMSLIQLVFLGTKSATFSSFFSIEKLLNSACFTWLQNVLNSLRFQ